MDELQGFYSVRHRKVTPVISSHTCVCDMFQARKFQKLQDVFNGTFQDIKGDNCVCENLSISSKGPSNAMQVKF